MADLYPFELPFHTRYKRGHTHPLFWTRVAEADHIVPGSIGGDWKDLDNLGTACVACNARKGNYTVEDLDWSVRQATPDPRWDGMVSLFRPLWRQLPPSRQPRYQIWLRALKA